MMMIMTIGMKNEDENDGQDEKRMMIMTIGMKNDDENDDQEGRAERGNEDGYVCFPWM